MRNIISNILLVLLLAFMAVVACKKGSEQIDYNPNIQAANNQVIAERAFSDVFNIFFRVVSDTSLRNTGSNEIYSANCTYQDDNGIEYVIQYPYWSVSCPDGKYRAGTITATLDKDFWEPGSVATLVFTDYFVDNLSLDGNNTISNDDKGMSAEMVFIHEVPSATLTFHDTTTQQSFQWESQKYFVWTEGRESLYDTEDDVFEISGTSNGTDLNNVYFSAVIDTALGNYFNCRWIRTGRTIINTPGLNVKDGYIDYIGDDNCTDLVIYYFDGNAFYDRFYFH
jgi:hypothetical protein